MGVCLPVSLFSLSPASVEGGGFASRVRDAAELGFGGILWRGGLSLLEDEPGVPAELSQAVQASGLHLVVEAAIGVLPLSHPLVQLRPDLFAIRRHRQGDEPVDPRRPFAPEGLAVANLGAVNALEPLLPRLQGACRTLASQNVHGLLLQGAGSSAPGVMTRLVAALRIEEPALIVLGQASAGQPLPEGGLDGVIVPDAVEGGTVPNGLPLLVDMGGPEEDLPRRLMAAGARGHALVVPAAVLERGDEMRQLVSRAVGLSAQSADFTGEIRSLTGEGAPVAVFARGDEGDMRQARSALITLFNRSADRQPSPDPATILPFMGADFGEWQPLGHDQAWADPLSPHEVRLFSAQRASPIRIAAPVSVEVGTAADRLVIEDIHPRVDGGPFPVKRIVGEKVAVEATLFGDGHEQLAAELWWRAADGQDWQRVRMEQHPNDLWCASFPLTRLGRHEFRIEGWLDRFGGFRRDFAKKLEAQVAQPVDHDEGRVLVEAALGRASGAVRDGLEAALARIAQAPKDERGAALLLSPELARLMDEADDRPHRIRSSVQAVDAERTAARYSSWYELFPRSQSDSPARHGTFDDVIARLPAVRDMGFDTLYFPPIHPIGKTNRKGPNNTLTPGPDDPGSPYAIGSEAGGHEAIHPELGTFEDFKRLIEAARAHGLEIALDFAIQCSPDHPWLKEHPGWFAWRPDGSMKYAENPPKKYQDIVNVDFYGPDAVPDLWVALRDIILLWVSHGVKTFRVDNPHTKPLPFWEWMIADVRARDPEVIFLAEAFTRPSMMYRLGKIGFSQSYTYFTWRDDKKELTDYIGELTTTAPKEFYRPHFFVNTPDINPIFLQTSGRPGFKIRAVLAATLSGLFGVYSGFELCEAAPLPGKEEYLDSETFEIKPRDWQAPGNIIADITLLNRLRRTYPALQTHLNTRFFPAHNDKVIWYGKPAPDGSHTIMVMVSLDPHHAQEADFELPLWDLGVPDDGSVAVHDLVEGHRFRWHGKYHRIRLDPEQPYRIWRVAPGDDA